MTIVETNARLFHSPLFGRPFITGVHHAEGTIDLLGFTGLVCVELEAPMARPNGDENARDLLCRFTGRNDANACPVLSCVEELEKITPHLRAGDRILLKSKVVWQGATLGRKGSGAGRHPSRYISGGDWKR